MLSKSFHPDDYDDLTPGLRDINQAICRARGKGLYVNIPHEHRLWEYASALQATRQHGGLIANTVDIGCGHSALSVALTRQDPKRVCLETDPEDKVAYYREDITKGFPRIEFQQKAVMEVEGLYDAVYCMSVIEHIPAEEQNAAWNQLANLVAPGGLLFITTDCCDEWRDSANPSDREEFYTPRDIENRVFELAQRGFSYDIDTTYNGNYVYDYTFFRLAMRRRA